MSLLISRLGANMAKTETRATCKTCGGGLTFHDSRHVEDVTWAHNDKNLSETAGHAADPDTATIETVEVN
jgi:hypothetical protein